MSLPPLPQMEQLQSSLQAACEEKVQLEEDLQRNRETVGWDGREVQCPTSPSSFWSNHLVFQVAETQSLQHLLELQLQEKEDRMVEAERSSLQREAQLEQQVSSEAPQLVPWFSQI